MSIDVKETLYGWHKGAPTEADFESGQLLVIYRNDRGSLSCHNVDRGTHDFMLEETIDKYEAVYWKKFDIAMPLPEHSDDVYISLSWTQERGANEVCLGG